MRNALQMVQLDEDGAYDALDCSWGLFRSQLLLQWKRLTPKDLDMTGPDRQRIALLVERKYGIAAHMVENYLRNFERTLPMAA